MTPTDVTVQDVQDRTEFDLSLRFEETYLETLVEDIIALILETCPRVTTRLASGALTESNYKRVVADAVKRVVRNPDGTASEGEGGYSYSTSAVVASGTYWLTQQDIRVLNGVTTGQVYGTVGMGLDSGWGR
jgi:hypothetical protein